MSAAPDAIAAPAAWKSESGMLAPAPAPDWTTTACLAATSFLIVSGVAATRVSPGRVSAGTPICMNLFPLLIFPPRDPGGQANPDDTTGISETSPACPVDWDRLSPAKVCRSFTGYPSRLRRLGYSARIFAAHSPASGGH